MKLIFLLPSLCLLASGAAPAAVISQWNFNGASATTVPGGTASPNPSLGSGTAILIGGVTSTAFSSGTANGGSSDPVTSSPSNYGWQTSTYPAVGTANETGGVEFAVSTLGYDTITINYDLRHSNSSSRFEAVQYSTDGTTFSTVQYFTGAAGDTWYNGRSVDLSGIPGVNNNPNFKIRLVAAFESSALGSGPADYLGSTTGTAYAPTGTWRFDMVTISGIPEPSTLLLGLLGGATALGRRRRR